MHGKRFCAAGGQTGWRLGANVGPHYKGLLCHVNDFEPHYRHGPWGATGIQRWSVGASNLDFKVKVEFLRGISDTSRKQPIPVLADSNERSGVESSGFVQGEYHWSWGESEASWSAAGELICPKWPLKLARGGWVLAWTRGHRERMGSWGSHQLKDQDFKEEP